jgi:hypothetical protein
MFHIDIHKATGYLPSTPLFDRQKSLNVQVWRLTLFFKG